MRLSQQPDYHFIEINSLFLRLGMLSPQNSLTKQEIIGDIRAEIKRLRELGFELAEYEEKLKGYE